MSDEQKHELERLLEAERGVARLLEAEASELRQKTAGLESALQNYKPMAEQWLREHGPSREDCEKLLKEMLDHPESLLDFTEVVRDLEKEWKARGGEEHAA